MSKSIIIIGAGGVGREIAATLRHVRFTDLKVLGFVDDNVKKGSFVNQWEVLGSIEWLVNNNENYSVIIAIGNPLIRKNIIEKLGDAFSYPTIIHPNVSIHDIETVKIGNGCYIADGCIFTTDITIEDFCFINTGCSFQHDTFIKTNSVLMPGVRITGGAKIGKNTFIATGCTITNAVEVEDNSVIRYSINNIYD